MQVMSLNFQSPDHQPTHAIQRTAVTKTQWRMSWRTVYFGLQQIIVALADDSVIGGDNGAVEQYTMVFSTFVTNIENQEREMQVQRPHQPQQETASSAKWKKKAKEKIKIRRERNLA